MIPILNDQEIEKMRQGGQKLEQILTEVMAEIKPGKTLSELEEKAEKRILELGGQPSFKMVPDYHWASCINLNEGVVHGIPDKTMIKKGDLVSFDLGFYSQGFHSDMARTMEVITKKKTKFLRAGQEALASAIAQVKPGNRVGHLSQAIEKSLKKAGYQPVKHLTGHGVGRRLHQDPVIPGFLERPLARTPLLKKGMVLAIEVIYTQGSAEIVVTDDGWTIRTQDGKIAGLFEETVAVGANGPLVLTD